MLRSWFRAVLVTLTLQFEPYFAHAMPRVQNCPASSKAFSARAQPNTPPPLPCPKCERHAPESFLASFAMMGWLYRLGFHGFRSRVAGAARAHGQHTAL